MVITKIEEHSKGKYKVYLNDEFAFVLYRGELRRFSMREEEQLADEVYHEIMNVILVKRAKLRAMHLLEKMDRTENDLRGKLKENLYPESAIEEAVRYVKSYHYVDDERYIREYISSHSYRMSMKEMQQKLIGKGVPKQLIMQVVEAMEPDERRQESELVFSLMKKKCHNQIPKTYEDKRRVYAYLMRKGFQMSDIEHAYRVFETQDVY